MVEGQVEYTPIFAEAVITRGNMTLSEGKDGSSPTRCAYVFGHIVNREGEYVVWDAFAKEVSRAEFLAGVIQTWGVRIHTFGIEISPGEIEDLRLGVLDHLRNIPPNDQPSPIRLG